MRLAKDALVLTVHKESGTAYVGLLSQTLCSERNLDTLVLPALGFKLPNYILALPLVCCFSFELEKFLVYPTVDCFEMFLSWGG